MDLVELSRQRAKSLHYQIAAEYDPWRPYQFAVAAAAVHQLSVESCAAGATVLDGARANFISEYEYIFHEDIGSPFEQAFLVAHEIGHALLGDGEHDETALSVEIDASRSAESSPLGIDRVVDYSRRQRREVQMDLFARELLLPREWVKNLHLYDGMTCSDIAEKMGAPFDVVAQQLLDALLLPPVAVQESTPSLDIPLNQQQRHAARHRGEAFLLQAGPGTGKTRTLVARVESLLDEGVDPKRILLLTFSNKAAAEMSDRIASKRPQAATSLWIGTFHGFGLDILRRFNDECGLPSSPRLLDRVEAVDFIEEEILRLGLKHYRNVYDPAELVADMLGAISRAKDEVVDADGYMALAQKMLQQAGGDDEKEVAAQKAAEIAKVYSFYEAAKQNRGAVDFGDLVMKPVLLLEQNEAVRLKLQDTYDHVLVDEYQDVNRSSIRLLNLLKPDGKNFWAVGDAKQSVYRFRGASSFNMSRFGSQDFPGGVTESLETNYRSTPEIVNAFNTFSQGMSSAKHFESNLEASRAASGITPELRTTADKTHISAAIAEAIQQHHKEGFAYRDQAVLTRGNSALSILAAELESLGVPVLFLGSLFERPEIRDLIALLTLLIDRRAMGLLRLANWPQFSMSMEDVVIVFDYLRESHAEPRAWFSAEFQGLSKKASSSLVNLRNAVQGFDDTSNPWQVLASFLLDKTQTAGDIAKSLAVSEKTKGIAIWQLMNFLRVQPSGQGLPIARTINRIRRLVHLRDERELRQLPLAAQSIDAVRLMTVHGAKGLEFPIVHLAGCNQDTIPGNYQNRSVCPPPEGMIEGAEGDSEQIERAAYAEEQECLFYVATSRAKDRLLFYAAKAAGNRARPLSTFLNSLGNLRSTHVLPQTVLPLSPDQLPIKVSFSGIPRFGSEKISLYESCGRRFLYTHLLQVGGRRRMTSFTNMHDAVREVYKSVIDAPNSDNHNCEALLDAAFIKLGLNEHGYVEEYRQIAKSMLNYFIESRGGAEYQAPTALQVTYGNCHIEVRPDDIIVRNGKCTLRKVKTGHKRSADHEDVSAAALILAARKYFPHAEVELVYLADEIAVPLTLTEKKLATRQERLVAVLSGINKGLFEASRSEFTCPNCPAFFVCGSTPSGTLIKNF
jgi:superfamily I DNA/RNA helicase/Zn-dependent peptidase ImmA (M78 family)